MSWQDIIKYNREHYVKAGRKHNDPNTVEMHKKILDRVKNSKIKDRKMGREIMRTIQNIPIIPITSKKLSLENNGLSEYIEELIRYLEDVENTTLNEELEKVKAKDGTGTMYQDLSYRAATSQYQLNTYFVRVRKDLGRFRTFREDINRIEQDPVKLNGSGIRFLQRLYDNHKNNLRNLDEEIKNALEIIKDLKQVEEKNRK